MCVIIIKEQDNIINHATLLASAMKNPDGLGIVWLDTYEIEKIESAKYEKLLTKRPFIAHFRYATVGKINLNNCHPFSINKDNVLFQNGTVPGLGNLLRTDTEELAEILSDMPRRRWRSVLEMTDCRYVIANTKTKKYNVYNKKLWHVDDDGILYSKPNVLGFSLMAVYGTLKYRYSNYYSYLAHSEYVGRGETVNKYPLIIEGLPYLLSKEGKGHNVEVDVFLVDKETLADVDMLEGHPNWYKRKEIDIQLYTGDIVKSWIYFNDTTEDTKNYHQAYTQEPSFNSYNDDYYDYDAKDFEFGGYDSNVTCDACVDQLWYDEFEDRLYCLTCNEYKDHLINNHEDEISQQIKDTRFS